MRDRFARGPITIDLPEGKVVIELGDYQQALFAKVVNAARWPAFVIDLHHGRYGSLGAGSSGGRKAGTRGADRPADRYRNRRHPGAAGAARERSALDMLGRWNFASYLGSAGMWPTMDLGDGFRLPVRDETPILFVQGD